MTTKRTFLFDLDGTLLPLDMDEFMKNYFSGVKNIFNKLEMDSQLTAKAFFDGTKAMFDNDGSKTNEQAFWDTFNSLVNYEGIDLINHFETFYQNEFQDYQKNTSLVEGLNDLMVSLKQSGHQLIVATNPLFPKVASHSRVQWAGLDIDLFDEITTYENYHYTKPNPNYYIELMNRHKFNPQNTLMVGNDAQEDLAVRELGIKTYIINDHLIDRNAGNYMTDYEGSMNDFLHFMKQFIEFK